MEGEIAGRLASERARLEREAGIRFEPVQHFRRPVERPFTAEERGHVTILFGGLTWKHERFIEAVFRGNGYRFDRLPTPDGAAFQIGKEYADNGLCNPAYFTIGNLIQHLERLEARGLSRQQILENYVFFTAGSCGPCRFGMYESQYRLALQNAGFDGFRVLLFQQEHGVKASSGEPGLKFTVDLGMGALNALILGDVVNDLIYQIRPYEVQPGETDRVFSEVVEELSRFLRERVPFEILERMPAWVSGRLAQKKSLKNALNTLGKIRGHLKGKEFRQALEACRERIDRIEVDRTRVKPLVKITGEFWAQLTEGDGNFNMFAFLEREGAQVHVEPISTWVMYLLHQAKANALRRKGLDVPYDHASWWRLGKRLANQLPFRKKVLLIAVGSAFWDRQYRHVAGALGGLAHQLVPQAELARLAHPFYNSLARGGEGHLEIGKNVYYTVNRRCHMVLALKPFGCMPSTQSDGVQSVVMNRFKEMTFLPVETSGEGEINAQTRVQMALGEAKVKARREFEEALHSTGKRLEDIQAYVADHPELRRPLYPVPHLTGIAGVAPNFILHVSDCMDGRSYVQQ
jgi:predicted nucleotide-binding protein (sugar kinase/HSP70/actin superfamily)